MDNGDAAKLEAPSLKKEDLELDICCDFTDTDISAAIKNLKPRVCKVAGPNRINLHMQSFCTSRNRKMRNDVVLKEQITNSRVRIFSELVGIAFQHQQN